MMHESPEMRAAKYLARSQFEKKQKRDDRIMMLVALVIALGFAVVAL